MRTATTTVKTIKLACPLCGSAEGALTLDLNALGTIECGECSATFTASKAVARAAENLRRWEAVAPWLDNVPV
jgi:transcription elongation factor Elf1